MRDVCQGNNALHYGKSKDVLQSSSGIVRGAAKFNSRSSELHVPTLNGYEWASSLTISIWFKKSGGISSNIISNFINNQSDSTGSWGILVSNNGGTMDTIRATLVTSQSRKSWDNITMPFIDHWHHFVMTYDGYTVSFYHNNRLALIDRLCCRGNIVSSNSDVVIGGRIYGQDLHAGYIDEVKILKRSVDRYEVTKLYQLKTL